MPPTRSTRELTTATRSWRTLSRRIARATPYKLEEGDGGHHKLDSGRPHRRASGKVPAARRRPRRPYPHDPHRHGRGRGRRRLDRRHRGRRGDGLQRLVDPGGYPGSGHAPVRLPAASGGPNKDLIPKPARGTSVFRTPRSGSLASMGAVNKVADAGYGLTGSDAC